MTVPLLPKGQLEKQLITKKQAAAKLANLIADDFQEIDFNGTVREKHEVMQWLNHKSSSIRVGLNIKAKVLSETVILISYLCSTKPNPHARARRALAHGVSSKNSYQLLYAGIC